MQKDADNKGVPRTRSSFPRAKTLEQFFWDRVDKTEGCWMWGGAKTALGYGQINFQGVRDYAYRYAWKMANGPIPEGAYIDHLCHSAGCVNPSHLRAATPGENMENRKGAHRNSKTGIRGVHWHKGDKRYVAQVKHQGRVAYRGYFTDIDEAARAVAEARRRIFKEPGGD